MGETQSRDRGLGCEQDARLCPSGPCKERLTVPGTQKKQKQERFSPFSSALEIPGICGGFFLNGSLIAAGIYVGEVRFSQVVTSMGPSFANNSRWEFDNLLLWQSSQHFQTVQATQDEGFIRHFPKWDLETPASFIGSKSLPGVSQAQMRAELCPELIGVFVCCQIFIE